MTHPRRQSSEPEQWFRRAITDGMKGLAALRLDGTPAADLIGDTRDVWAAVLWPRKHWVEHLDTERLHKGFRSLCGNATRWPAPADLLANLPSRAPQEALPAPELTAAQRRANLERLKAIVAGVNA
ncbi:MAG: hypothetical protein ACOY42_02135 [Pseudomonadota bacterium]